MSDPVAVEFSLNTQMFLLSKKSLWLSDGSSGFGQESDVAFSEGETFYFLDQFLKAACFFDFYCLFVFCNHLKLKLQEIIVAACG